MVGPTLKKREKLTALDIHCHVCTTTYSVHLDFLFKFPINLKKIPWDPAQFKHGVSWSQALGAASLDFTTQNSLKAKVDIFKIIFQKFHFYH